MDVVEKEDLILAAAIKRFSYFGVHKTTLSEIAEDLGMSKQALLYYFSDKQSLIDAVKEGITREYLAALEKVFSEKASVEEALLGTVSVKRDFLERYFMLMTQFTAEMSFSGHELTVIKNEIYEREYRLVVELLEKGVETLEIKPLDASKTAELLLDTLRAFSRCITGEKFHPEPQILNAVFQKEMDLIRLFYKGLKS